MCHKLTGANRKVYQFAVKAVIDGSTNTLYTGTTGKTGGQDLAQKIKETFEVSFGSSLNPVYVVSKHIYLEVVFFH